MKSKVKKRVLCILLAIALCPVPEIACIECDSRGYATAESLCILAGIALRLTLFVLLVILLVGLSRRTLGGRALYVVAAGLSFPLLQRAGIECNQQGWPIAGSCFVSAAIVLRPVFLVLLLLFLVRVSRLHPHPAVRILLAVVLTPVFLLFCEAMLVSKWVVRDLSRPAWPRTFVRHPAVVSELTDLANEMIQRQRVSWIGVRPYRFVFAIRDGDADYQFASTLIPRNHDFHRPVPAEDMSKVTHFDSPFLSNALKPTDDVLLDPNDYAFCRRASNLIRRIGFDSAELLPEHNIVRYQIYEFIGWDNGWRYVYYYCPTGTLPESLSGFQRLNANWFYARKPRFSD